MANARKCDRCGSFYSKEDLLSNFPLMDERWRYSIYYDPHPYPGREIDLCANCLKGLYSWLHEFDKEGK